MSPPARPPLAIGALDHIGIAVRDAAAAAAVYRDLLGLVPGPAEELPHMGLRVVKIPIGDTRLELVEPRAPGSAIEKFLADRPGGLHHLCFAVRDIRAAAATCLAAGYRPLTEAPQRGADGALVLFLHPKATHGVLIELSQPAAGHGPGFGA